MPEELIAVPDLPQSASPVLGDFALVVVSGEVKIVTLTNLKALLLATAQPLNAKLTALAGNTASTLDFSNIVALFGRVYLTAGNDVFLWSPSPQQMEVYVNNSEVLHMRPSFIRVAAPFVFKDYTIATLPNPATVTRAGIYITDEAGGPTIAFSDGTNWRRVQDRAIVS